MSNKLCRVIQSLVVRSKRYLKVVTLNMATDAENPAPGAETTALTWAHKVIIKWVEKKKLSKSRTGSEQEPLSNPCETLMGEDYLKSFPFKVTKLDGRDIKNCKTAILIVQQLLCYRLQSSD